MKKFLRWATLCMAVALVTTACSDDDGDSGPLKADFKIAVTGSAPNAKLTITNTSTGATGYAWAFSPGAGTLVSTEKNPAELTIEKAGQFDVILVVTKGTESSTLTQSVTVEGNGSIVTYTGIEFSMKKGSTTYGRFFSTTTGKIYKDSEVTASNGKDIDIAFGSYGPSTNFFLSPNDKEITPAIAGTTTTAFVNYPSTSNAAATVAAFEAAKDDSFIAKETIKEDNNAFGTTTPGIILFQTQDGRKGAICTRAINSDRLLVDIKVQKY